MFEPNRRRLRMLDRKLQVGASLKFVGFVYVYLALFAILANVPAMVTVVGGTDDTAKYVAAVERLRVFVQVFVVPLVLTFLCMCLHGVIFTHRVAGPIHRLRETLRLVRARILPSQMKLREKDCFQDLCEEVNGLLVHLRGEVTDIRSLTNELAEEAAALESRDALPEEAREKLLVLANGFTRLRQIVDGYTIEGEPQRRTPAEKPVGTPVGSC